MTKEQFDSLLENLTNYKQELDNSEREKEEYLDYIIDDLEDREDYLLSEDVSPEDFFEDLKGNQDYFDAGWREDMCPDVDEEDEEYPDDYNPYNNETYRNHQELLNEIEDFFMLRTILKNDNNLLE